MKKVIVLCVALGLTASLVACSSSSTTTASPTSPATTTVAPSTTGTQTTTAAPQTFGALAQVGETQYLPNCAACHGTNGQGVSGPALWGANANLSRFGTGQALLTYISGNMPPGGGGSLSRDYYDDILCYLLIRNDYVSAATTFSESDLSGVTVK